MEWCAYIDILYSHISQFYIPLHIYVIGSTVQNGHSPLYMASSQGHTEVVDELLKHGADPNMATFVRVRLVLHIIMICALTECMCAVHDCMRYIMLVSWSSMN